MSILSEIGNGTGYLKAGFLGFPKSGKTWTAMLLATGLRDYLKLTGPIVLYDTESGSNYIGEEIKRRTGTYPLGIRSRKFDDLLAAGKEALSVGSSAMIVDSITHPWRELCDAYLAQVNEQRAKRQLSPQTRLEFQDWNKIKPKWARWTDFYLNSELHIIICGRAGWEWDFEEREDDPSKKDLVKTGVKMKTESEFGFEPSLLVQMTREQTVGKTGGKSIAHHALVLGDRFDAIDGAECDEPTFDFFLPHVARLVPGTHSPVDVETGSDFGLDQDGDDAASRERKLRTILCEKIQAALVMRWPGQKAEEKQAKVATLKEVFGTTSWTEVETRLSSDELKAGLERIEARS